MMAWPTPMRLSWTQANVHFLRIGSIDASVNLFRSNGCAKSQYEWEKRKPKTVPLA